MIKEVIIVEGKDDVSAVKKAVEAEIIMTKGYAISKQTYEKIETAYKKQGIIIFTDPDFAGERIRSKLAEKFPDCKHAYLSQDEARLGCNIGIENASADSIKAALKKARAVEYTERKEFTMKDLEERVLTGNKNAAQNRAEAGRLLGIGYGNAKAFLNRLNNFNIKREEFEEVVVKVTKNNSRER